jgi:hypothetical protein
MDAWRFVREDLAQDVVAETAESVRKIARDLPPDIGSSTPRIVRPSFDKSVAIGQASKACTHFVAIGHSRARGRDAPRR